MSPSSTPFRSRAAQAGVTEAFIRALIPRFYAKVRCDPTIGPLFNDAIADWDNHLEKIVRFWLSVTRLGAGYRAQDFMPAHLKHDTIGPEHLAVWLGLFRETLAQQGDQEAAAVLFDIAERMGESILFGLSRPASAARLRSV